MINKKTAVIIGRFQPFHLGHKSLVEEALKVADQVLILVGSANKSRTFENPLDYETRKNYILKQLKTIDTVGKPIFIEPIYDRTVYSDVGWGSYLLEEIKKLGYTADYFITGNEEKVKSWFTAEDLQSLKLIEISRSTIGISGSDIRENIYKSSVADLERDFEADPDLLEIYKTIRSILAANRFKEECTGDFVEMTTKARKIIPQMMEWVKDLMGNNKAVIGMSGGKDSTIAAAVCARALGKEHVYGVLLPQGEQHDYSAAVEACQVANIKYQTINIANIVDVLTKSVSSNYGEPTYQFKSNTPARIRMTVLYGVAAILGGARVVNTCNRSEDYVGYSTKFGDSAGDFSLFSQLTVSEVKAVGVELGLPLDLVFKKPEDGLSGKTDEDNLGFTYQALDNYLLTGSAAGLTTAQLEKIEYLHKINLHKLELMPVFNIVE